MSNAVENIGIADRVIIKIERPGIDSPPEMVTSNDVPQAADATIDDVNPAAAAIVDALARERPDFIRPLDSFDVPTHDGAITAAPESDPAQVNEATVQGVIREVKLAYNRDPQKRRVLFCTPSLGMIRIEWHHADKFMARPVNWQSVDYSPVGYDVAEARNDAVALALRDRHDWLLFIDHDVLAPGDALMRMARHMMRFDKPVVSGLYYTKCSFPEPLVFRGGANGPFYGWKQGEEFWVNGIPMGFALIHTSIFRAMRPPYFVTPRMLLDTESGLYSGRSSMAGTEDLPWCYRVIEEGVIQKAGWKVPDPANPFWMDTNIFCQHITPEGVKFPEAVGDAYVRDHEKAREAIEAHAAEQEAAAREAAA